LHMFMILKTHQKKMQHQYFELEKLENENDLKELKQLIKNHKKFTDSAVATRILKDWNNSISKFVKVMPTDYKRVMMELNETKLKVS